MTIRLTLCAACILVLFACKEEKRLEPVKSSDFDEFIRNPISMSGEIDTTNVARLTFEEDLYDFGEVDEGTVVRHTFDFTNTGKSPMLISEARSTCGCTVPSWPKEAIKPGESGTIEVKFNTQNRTGYQDKPVSIYANTLPGRTIVRLKGVVNKTGE